MTASSPDSASLKWPLKFSFQSKHNSGPVDVLARVTLGNSTAVAYFVQVPAADPIEVGAPHRKVLQARAAGSYTHALEIDLVPKKKDNTSYRSFAAFYSNEAITAAVAWIDGVEKINITDQDGARHNISASPALGCTAFVWSDHQPIVDCDWDAQELARELADEPWRNDVYIRPPDNTCPFPYNC